MTIDSDPIDTGPEALTTRRPSENLPPVIITRSPAQQRAKEKAYKRLLASIPKYSPQRVSVNIHRAFDKIGGLPAFADWAEADKKAFYAIYAKQAPREPAISITFAEPELRIVPNRSPPDDQ